MNRTNEFTERPERPPIQVLEHLRDNFEEISKAKEATGEPKEQIMKNWYNGVRVCFDLLKEDRLIPEGLIQEVNKFLEDISSPEFKLTVNENEKKDKTYKLIDKVLEGKPAGNQ
ncbi:MAG: hypothetical protein Q7K55_00900 [Candidatus Levybacteria bacterium]|nr:hypothetical protein [Candidatus Levybacteria bacterium]